MKTSRRLSHVDARGRVTMVDVGEKPSTRREAVARGSIAMSREALTLVRSGRVKKGDPLQAARLAGIMAREVGLDAHVAVRAAFVHDIGKAIDREMEGTHLQIGIDFLRKHGESEAVVMAMAAHHMDIDWPSLEAMIVQAADAISAARPGARRDILESYVKRLEKLEGIADSFKGVSKSFALQAGREIRIMVESEKISDEEAVWLSKDIARRIENELEYPGQIKVTVIRETRATDYAK